ncbi:MULTISPECIES: S9 family peptidase [unclassified Saccharicrinis]|uniref:S9 family peptidase n=1 Tax=unclassified Saccharicrinis TaxID=2646859 RepID=UPI003D335A59
MQLRLFFIVLLLGASVYSSAQYSGKIYSEADSLVNQMSKLIYNQVKSVHPINNSSNMWYKTHTAEGNQYWFVDAESEKKQEVFDQNELLKQLSDIQEKEQDWKKLTLTDEKVSANADTFLFKSQGYNWLYLTSKNQLIQKDRVKTPATKKHWAIARDELGQEPILSPDKKYTAYIHENNLFVKDSTGKATQLTFDGSPGEFYSSYLRWSPNSKCIALNKFRPSEKRFIKFVESSPKGQLQPKLKQVEYFKPGDALPIKQPCLFSIESMSRIPVDISSYMNQYGVSDPDWRKDSRAFTVEYNQRGHQKYTVLEVNANTGNLSVLAEENPETFFFYTGKRYRYDINDGAEMIWMSERDGWNHLYLYDNSGKVKNKITQGNWVVRKVVHVDEEKREIIFCASGKNKNEDPYHLHYYRIGFDGKGLKALTTENANHEVTFSHDFKYFVDYYSRADLPGKTVLCNAQNGKVIRTLEETDIVTLKETDWNMPEVFSAKGRDGETDIWGLIYRPSNFDPAKKYPVIEYIYAGPHNSFVPKSFLGINRRFAGLAELGFILVQIDGMGTSNRSKAFHDVCWKNLKDAGFPDRIKWMQAAAEKYPYMDIEHVGIFGGSAGGQSSTGAVLFHPEFYDVAVSSCGCHDNRMDKIWWNEQWMGYPIEKQYEECSNVVNAHKLQGNLMLILGEVDDNVDPASTMQVADALIKANKNFELVVLPGVNHTLGGNYGERKRRDFFIKHLKGEKTPAWNTESNK